MASEVPLAGYAAVQDYLFGLKTAGLKFGVDRMRILSDLLGHPERAVPSVSYTHLDVYKRQLQTRA